MPKSKSKRKARSGRGRTHRVLFTPYASMRHFPMWDEDKQALQLDVEVAFRVLRDGTASQDDLETAACTLAARFESSALIAEREDSQLLYIPHGEPGMRRMIAALLALRPPVENDPLEEQIRWFQADQPESASPMSVPESSARSAPR